MHLKGNSGHGGFHAVKQVSCFIVAFPCLRLCKRACLSALHLHLAISKRLHWNFETHNSYLSREIAPGSTETAPKCSSRFLPHKCEKFHTLVGQSEHSKADPLWQAIPTRAFRYFLHDFCGKIHLHGVWPVSAHLCPQFAVRKLILQVKNTVVSSADVFLLTSQRCDTFNRWINLQLEEHFARFISDELLTISEHYWALVWAHFSATKGERKIKSTPQQYRTVDIVL